MQDNYDVLIIGGGIIGCSVAYLLSSKYDLKIALLEKNPYFADETTSTNSGIIHSGLDCATGSLSAFHNIRGNEIWCNEWIPNLKINHLYIPSLVLAFNEDEYKVLETLYKQAIANGIKEENLRLIKSNVEVSKVEPSISKDVMGALWCDKSVIIDPLKTAHVLKDHAEKNGVKFFNNAKVVGSLHKEGGFSVICEDKRVFTANKVVNAAGHGADLITLEKPEFQLKVRRGQYIILGNRPENKVKNLCFKIPSIYGKGVLVAPLLDGRTMIGPTAEENIKKEDKHVVTIANYELIRNIGHSIIPTLNLDSMEKMVAASRSIEVNTNEFWIRESKDSKDWINVIGIKSPGLSAAPSIAKNVEELLNINTNTKKCH